MAIEQGKIVLLIRKYQDESITAEETLLLREWLAQDKENTDLLTQIKDESWLRAQLEGYHSLASEDLERESSRMAQQIAGRQVAKVRPIWIRYAVASMALIALSIGLYFYNPSTLSENETLALVEAERIPQPGGNKATLMIDGGETIALSEAHSGLIVAGKMAYEDGSAVAATATSFATLNTPRGGQYSITLPDGTKVRLNASSSLRYPVRFDGAERRVVLTGEAFFEVAHDARQPFIVETALQRLQVLGTVFNINAYTDEKQIATTLIQGKVAVSRAASGAVSTILSPGQQSLLDSKRLDVIDVDAAEAIAWKDGKFIFNNSDIHTVMRQIARWYDIEVQYMDDVSAVTFSGSLSRSAPITAILEDLELTQSITFNMEGRRVVVRKR